MCPFVVAMLVQSCLVTNFKFNPGHLVNLLFLVALMKVECTVLKQATCRYDYRYTFVSFFKLSLQVNALVWVGIQYNTDLYWVLGLYICFVLVV